MLIKYQPEELKWAALLEEDLGKENVFKIDFK
jgi:hypothetical protein